MAQRNKSTMGRDIRGVLIPMSEASMLLPNACVSEVITYGQPEPIDGAPLWVMGTIPWRGWKIPLFSYAQMTGRVEEESLSGAKVPILKAFGGVHRMPYMAVIAQGFPRLTSVTEANLVYSGEDNESLPGVKHTVLINDQEAFIPDLDAIERELLEVLEAA